MIFAGHISIAKRQLLSISSLKVMCFIPSRLAIKAVCSTYPSSILISTPSLVVAPRLAKSGQSRAFKAISQADRSAFILAIYEWGMDPIRCRYQQSSSVTHKSSRPSDPSSAEKNYDLKSRRLWSP